MIFAKTVNEPLDKLFKRVVRHAGDCSCNATNRFVCDCGALREGIRKSKSRTQDIWEAWHIHLRTLEGISKL